MTVELIDGRGPLCVKITGVASTAGGGIGEVENPEDVAVVITKCTLYVETPSTGAANLDVGVGATATDNTTLINALAVNGSITGKAYNGLNPAAKAEQDVWAADELLTITGSATTVGLVAYLFLEYVRVDES
jgi:hypothetical protein